MCAAFGTVNRLGTGLGRPPPSPIIRPDRVGKHRPDTPA